MLRFDDNGEFRILIVADIQDGKPLDEIKQNKITQLIEKSKPGLIVLLGDMIFGPVVFSEKKAGEIISSILKPLDASGVPFAFVTGNHDMDTRVPIGRQMEMFCVSPHCVTPLLKDRKCSGSYSLCVKDGEQPAVQLVFHDSGGTHITFKGILYDPASEEQLNFEKETFKEYGDIPVYIFQHIPVPEICELINISDKKTDGAVKAGSFLHRQYMVLKDPEIGTLGEHPSPPLRNSGQFHNWVQNGNVKAAVFGHDHKNSFCGDVEGIGFIQTACAGLACYGDDRLRGGRILIIKRDGSYSTEVLAYMDM